MPNLQSRKTPHPKESRIFAARAEAGAGHRRPCAAPPGTCLGAEGSLLGFCVTEGRVCVWGWGVGFEGILGYGLNAF